MRLVWLPPALLAVFLASLVVNTSQPVPLMSGLIDWDLGKASRGSVPKPIAPEVWLPRADLDLFLALAPGLPWAEKLRSYEQELYDSLPEGAADLLLRVTTVGEPNLIQGASHSELPGGRLLHGFRSSAAELAELAQFGRVEWTSQLFSMVDLRVSDKAFVAAVANLGFVYAVQLPKAVAIETESTSPTYATPWQREMQKVDEAWGSRDEVDGELNGRMPDRVHFAVIDTGYDAGETRFRRAYAAEDIDHCHRWTSDGTLRTWTRQNSTQTPSRVCGGEAFDNSHGTGTTDILSQANRHGGKFVVFNFAERYEYWRAYEHLAIHHPEVDVISSSVAYYVPGRSCVSLFDELLKDLTVNLGMHLSAVEQNPGNADVSMYPGHTTFAVSTGGLESGDPWSVPEGAHYGPIELDPEDCPVQAAIHQETDGATQIFKPDVYGFQVHLTDIEVDGNAYVGGTSWAQPSTASGLGTIASRSVLGLSEWIPTKDWDPDRGCWSGAVDLVWRSGSPDGRSVEPTAAYDASWSTPVGRLQDHDAWFLDNPNC